MVERAGVTGAGLATGGGDETGAEVVTGGLVEAGALGGRPRGRVLWQFPESPGRQREHGLPLLTHAHLRHLAEPLHRQQRVLAAIHFARWFESGLKWIGL